MSSQPPPKSRLQALLRSRRLRAAALLLASYKAYTTFKTQTTLHKTFSGPRHRPGQTVLDLDLDAVNLVTTHSLNLLSPVEELRLQRLISTLHRAKDDPRVTALVVRGISGLSAVGLAEIAELRDAVRDFSEGWGGKSTVLHVPEGLGAAGNGTIPMYFASAFDSVHVQPTSGVIVPGLSLATLFIRRLLDNLGVKAKKVARKEFKTAANSFTEDKFTDPHRESTEALLSAIMSHLVQSVATDRNIPEENVRQAIDTAIMSPKQAQAFGILDQPLYRDELPAHVRDQLRRSAAVRAEARELAATEWRDAMKQLQQAWAVSGGAAEMWADGDVLRNASQFETALPVALTFGDQRVEQTKLATDAEIRALKAHVAWLDTCPWEMVEGKEVERDSVYGAEANISAIMETERQLCENAVRTLEACPALVESYRQSAQDDYVLELGQDNALSLIRWCRGMWRAKSIAARIVGTLKDSDEELHRLVASEKDESLKERLEDLASSPRLFLVGFTDDLANAAVNIKAEEAEKEKAVENTDEDEKKDIAPVSKHLRYVKFADYVDMLHAEKRAVLDRASGSFVVRRSKNDRFSKLPGTIDAQERNALLRLQLPGHQFAPWRVNVPKGDVIAVISIDGPISDESADEARSAIRKADKDPMVKGIVLRIDSPGGSATASDLISRAVEVAQKPVVASMSNVCASGGYFISAPCDKVFASNMTITGSIGVIFSAFNTSGLFEKLGITADSCESGKFSKYFGAQGSITEWSDEFATRIDAMIDSFYSDFVNVVAKGRGMQFEQAEKIARGRVWAGSDALALGLVDEIGGLREAIQAAAELAYLAPDMEVRAVDYPTLTMVLQEAARKRGLMPSNLDEEGDESFAPRRGWFRSPPKDNYDSQNDGSDDIALSPAAIMSRLAMEFANLQDHVTLSILGWLDNFLLSASGTSGSAGIAELMLNTILRRLRADPTSAIISEELERTRATAGRPAAIAPHVRLDD